MRWRFVVRRLARRFKHTQPIQQAVQLRRHGIQFVPLRSRNITHILKHAFLLGDMRLKPIDSIL